MILIMAVGMACCSSVAGAGAFMYISKMSTGTPDIAEKRKIPLEPSMRQASTPAETRLVRKVQDLSAVFVNHLKLHYLLDPRAQTLLQQWTGVVSIYENATASASYDRTRGMMYINPRSPENQIDDRLRSKILHELAHSTPGGHGAAWLDTWSFFLQIATNELDWKCQLRCNSCVRYSLCALKQCPKCTWIDGFGPCAAKKKPRV